MAGLGFFGLDRAQDANVKATAVAQERDNAEVNLQQVWNSQALFLADLSRQQLKAGSPQNALLLALQSLEHYLDGIYYGESGTALINAVYYPVQEAAYLRHEGAVYGAAWNPDETRILSWSYDGTARVWDAATSEVLLPAPRHAGERADPAG